VIVRNGTDLLRRATEFLDCFQDCDCRMCELGRDIRAHLASQPDADTLRRWYPTLEVDLSRRGGAL